MLFMKNKQQNVIVQQTSGTCIMLNSISWFQVDSKSKADITCAVYNYNGTGKSCLYVKVTLAEYIGTWCKICKLIPCSWLKILTADQK